VSRRYRLGAFTLESGALFPELPAAPDEATADVRLRFRRGPFEVRPAEWSHHWTLPNGDLWMSLGRAEGRYFFHFPGYADFAMSADGREVSGFRQPGVAASTARHLFLDQVFPVLLSRRGHIVLHGSAVASPHGALVFVAASGGGKSTLAAAFAGSGCPFLTDDCLVLRLSEDGVEAVPSYPGLRVWPDVLPALTGSADRLPRVSHYSVKRRLAPGNVSVGYTPDPLPVRRIYFLGDPAAAIRVAAIPPQPALIELVKFNYLYDPHDRAALEWQFRSLSVLARLPLFYRLEYPRDLARLPQLRQAILEQAARD